MAGCDMHFALCFHHILLVIRDRFAKSGKERKKEKKTLARLVSKIVHKASVSYGGR